MSILVIAEHDNTELKTATLNTVAAGMAIGGDIDILVAGSDCDTVAESAAQVPGVGKVLLANKETYKNSLAENVGNLVVELAEGYSHILAPATTNGTYSSGLLGCITCLAISSAVNAVPNTFAL